MNENQDLEIKKRYLKRYRKNKALIHRLETKVEILEQRITGLRSPKYSDMPRGGTPITKEELIDEKDEIKDRIKRLEVKGKKYRSEILDKIDELDDTRYAEILESFCINCKDLDIIAEDMGYTTRHIYALYSEAIREIEI